MTDEKKQQIITALLRERAMYEQVGNTAGAAEVTAELHRLGVEAKPPAKRAQRRSPRRSEE